MKHTTHTFLADGFTLIELIVATLIASMISAVLLTALYQSSSIQASVDTTIDFSERIGIMSNLLEKDLAGAFVPMEAHRKDDEKGGEKNVAPDEKGDNTQKAAEKKNGTEQKPEKKKEQKKPIEKIFYSTSKNGMLDTLTFVTNNPLVVFVGKDVGVVKPKAVRVQYRLKPEDGSKDSYVLVRQESNELDLAEYKNVREQEVIGGIKKLSVSFTARIEKKSESSSAKSSGGHGKTTADAAGEQKKKQEKEKKVYEYKVQPEWVSEQKKDAAKSQEKKETDKKEPEFPRIPYSVEFKITLWNKQKKKDVEYVVVCHIPVDSIEAEMIDKKQQEMPKKAEQKPESNAGGAKPQSNQQHNAMNGQQVIKEEVVVYNGIEVLSNALDSLKKLLGHA